MRAALPSERPRWLNVCNQALKACSRHAATLARGGIARLPVGANSRIRTPCEPLRDYSRVPLLAAAMGGLFSCCCGESAEARAAREAAEAAEVAEARGRAAAAAEARQAAFDKGTGGKVNRAAQAAKASTTYGATADVKRSNEVVAGWNS